MAYTRKKSKQDLSTVLSTAKKRWDIAYQSQVDNINAGYADLKFLAGEQWLDSVARERLDEGRLMLTHNRLPQFIRQITGDMRLNKPAIKVRPAGGNATDDIADIYTGLIRNIETCSQGPLQYVLAGQDAARAGWGCFRLVTEYADVDMFEQDIRIRWNANPMGVVFDPDAVMPTREDAKYCFVITRMTYERFKADWPDAKVSSWDDASRLYMGTVSSPWFDAREIAVAEYWVKEPEKDTLVKMGDGSIFLAGHPPKMFQGMDEKSLIAAAVKTRKVEVDCVYQYIMTAFEVLEGPTEWAGRYIPIIPVAGEEINVGDRTVRHGAIRFAIDPQRSYNYHVTTATEVHALAPKAPFMVTPEQVKGFEKEWRQANRRNLPYLRYNPDAAAGTNPPQRSNVSTNIDASMVLAEQAANDMHATIGIYPPSLGQKSNETSGRAIVARQREADVGTYVYIDNLATAIQYAGRQLIDLIPKIYDTERIVRVLDEDGTTRNVTINQEQRVNGAIAKIENDVTVGKYDVVVEVGPAFSTRRAEATDMMMQLIQANPQIAPLVMDLIIESQDWPLKEKFVERLKAVLPPGIDPEIDAENAERRGPPQGPNPMQQLAMASEAAKIGQTKANTEKAQVETQGKFIQNMHDASELGHKHGQMQQGIYGQNMNGEGQ